MRRTSNLQVLSDDGSGPAAQSSVPVLRGGDLIEAVEQSQSLQPVVDLLPAARDVVGDLALPVVRAAARSVEQALAAPHDGADAGGKMIHNGWLNFGESVQLEDMIELAPSLQDSLIAIDEMHTLMDPRRAQGIVSYLMSHVLVQLGHRRTWLCYTTQQSTMIDSRLRWQTDVAVWPSTRNEGRTVTFWVVQQGSIGPQGARIKGTLRRADRFWNLYDTSMIMDSTESVFMTTEQLREKDEYKRLEKVMLCLWDFHQAGEFALTTGRITLELGRNYGVRVGPAKIGRIIASLGVKEKRMGTVRGWNLKTLPFDVQEAAS